MAALARARGYAPVCKCGLWSLLWSAVGFLALLNLLANVGVTLQLHKNRRRGRWGAVFRRGPSLPSQTGRGLVEVGGGVRAPQAFFYSSEFKFAVLTGKLLCRHTVQ